MIAFNFHTKFQTEKNWFELNEIEKDKVGKSICKSHTCYIVHSTSVTKLAGKIHLDIYLNPCKMVEVISLKKEF